jgi:hypoxanthine phosphoribosyltransferase
MAKNFDGIISIGRGGTIVGAILASKLGTRIHPVFVVHSGKGQGKSTEIAQLGIAPELSGGKYLLVDDKCFTGETFSLLKKTLNNLNIETASIFCNSNQFSPDYYAYSTEEETIFPYEI